MISLTAAAQLRFKQIGAPLASASSVLSLWLVEGDTLERCVAIKVQETGKSGESNVVLDSQGLARVKELSAQAMAHTKPLEGNEIVLIGSVPAKIAPGETKIDVAVVRYQGQKVRVLVAHEGAKEHSFLLDGRSQRELASLLEKGRSKLTGKPPGGSGN